MTPEEIERLASVVFNKLGKANPTLHLVDYCERLMAMIQELEIELMATKEQM